MRTICPKIFATLGLFATMSQMRVAHFALKIFLNFEKLENFIRVKDKLAVVLP